MSQRHHRHAEERAIAALVHGRYLLETPADPEGRPLVVGFHGYGENADVHLEQLRRLPGANRWVLCAVQALHPFYNRAGEVIASWMTREQREHAIEDNIRYAASVVAEVKRELPVSQRLAYLGFSQGAAMAYRAAAGSGHPCLGVVVLGGDVPPELELRDLSHFPPVLLGKMKHDVELLRKKGVDIRPCVFEGGHEWTNEFRAEAGRFLEEVFRPAA